VLRKEREARAYAIQACLEEEYPLSINLEVVRRTLEIGHRLQAEEDSATCEMCGGTPTHKFIMDEGDLGHQLDRREFFSCDEHTVAGAAMYEVPGWGDPDSVWNEPGYEEAYEAAASEPGEGCILCGRKTKFLYNDVCEPCDLAEAGSKA